MSRAHLRVAEQLSIAKITISYNSYHLQRCTTRGYFIEQTLKRPKNETLLRSSVYALD